MDQYQWIIWFKKSVLRLLKINGKLQKMSMIILSHM